MITQTWALILDAYRDLNARKLFWISLIISAMFMLGFGLIGADAGGLKLLWIHWDMPGAEYLYKQIFSWIVLGLWLTLGAIILALISTSGIFPDFISGGAIDLYLSKPMGRLRLFLTKYATGLLFVALQVSLVAVLALLILGLRSGEWKPQILLAIPIVVCFFSYLFSVSVFFGIATRSTVAALLLTIVCWGAFWGVHKVEIESVKSMAAQDYLIDYYRGQIQQGDDQIAAAQSDPATNAVRLESLRDQRISDQRNLDSLLSGPAATRRFQRIVHGIKTVLPKTTETTDLTDRLLFQDAEISRADNQSAAWMFGGMSQNRDFAAQLKASEHGKAVIDLELRHRSLAWIIGTSLLFEAVLLSLSAWIFCRRDY